MWLGIDVGTGGTRALVIDEGGAVRGACTAQHESMSMPRPTWAEQHPENWWDAAAVAIGRALTQAGISGASVTGIGMSGQMHGLVSLDASGQVIRPALIWCDQRSQAQVDAVNTLLGVENIVRWTANPVLTGFTLPKLLWVRDCEPRNFERIRKVLLPKDYVRYRLTGAYATDVSDASGTALFDVANRCWSQPMLQGLGLDSALLPSCHESVEITGAVTPEAAGVTGLAPGTPVVGGGGDQAASAVGNGIVEPGNVSCTVGTSGVVFAHMEQVAYDSAGRVHTFCHAVRGKWHVMGVTQGAGMSLEWLRNQVTPSASYDAITAEAAQVPPGANGLFWLPYLMGERTPHLDALARGGWVGLTASHTRADLIRAVLEGVAYSLRDCLEIIRSMELPIDGVRLSGGGARSAVWRGILASIFGKRVATLATQEGSAYGAALLALAGTAAGGNVAEVCRATIRETGVLEPDAAEAALYERSYQVYQSLYPALRPIYANIATL